MADIQDWVFFHGWEVVALGKLMSLFLVSRFVGILSIERRPFLQIFQFNRGMIRKDVLVALIIFLLGIVIVGDPKIIPNFEFNFYQVTISFIGQLIFYGSDALLILALNQYLPLKKRYWNYQIVIFSLISFIIQRNVFLFGLRWEGDVIFSLILVFYLLRFRDENVWLHSLLTILLLFAPLATIFGLDPLWGSRFSPFSFTNRVSGLEVGVFTLMTLFYLKNKEKKALPI